MAKSTVSEKQARFERGDGRIEPPLVSTGSATQAGLLQLDGTAADIQMDGTQGAGANGLAADSGHVHPAACSWVPADSGLLMATWDPAYTPITGILTGGTVYLSKLTARTALTITYLWFQVTAVGSGTSTGTFCGLYSSSGSLLTGSSDLVSQMTTQGSAKCALTTPQNLTAGQFVWAAILANLSSTQPSMGTGLGTQGSLANAGISSAASYRFAVNGTSVTALPSPSITPASNALTNRSVWVGAS